MYYGEIKSADVANGLGVRVTLFVSGCTNCCPGCFQKQTWDFNYGKPFTKETVQYILDALDKPFISGLTLLGGEPFELSNQEVLVQLLKDVKAKYPNKNIWCFTGFLLDHDLCEGGRRYGPYTKEFLSMIDILVDGPFIQAQKDMMLKYRGSSNQRVIDMHKTREEGKIVLYTFD